MSHSFKDKFSYWFDNYMSKGSKSIFLALLITFIAGFILVVALRLLASSFLANDVNSEVGIWRIFLQMTDPGNMAQDNDSGWAVKTFAIFSGMFGIIFFSAVIAFITTQLDLKLQDLKKGKSAVLEEDHILILGWNDDISDILKELIEANESEKDACVVILSPKIKEEMDDYILDKIEDPGTTRIVTRTGDTSSLRDLNRVAVNSAGSIIVLPEATPDNSEAEKAISDAHIVKTMISIMASTNNNENETSIVTQVYSESNQQVITKINDEITLVYPEDMVAKIAVQTSRSSGLAAVYVDLIGFEGCEFYFYNTNWNGLNFGQLPYHFPDGIPIGLRDEDGKIIINPPADTILKENDNIIIIAEDDSTIDFKPSPIYQANDYNYHEKRIEAKKERALILGWNAKGYTIIDQYMDYMLEGSKIDIVVLEVEDKLKKEIKKLDKEYKDHDINLIECNYFDFKEIMKLSPAKYDNTIILSFMDENQEVADAKIINVLILLREAIKQSAESDEDNNIHIIAEVLNSDNLELITHTGVQDAIISTKMVSKIIAQIAQEPDVLDIYDEIFEEDGSEIYLKPLDLYFEDIPEKVYFADLIHIAQKRKEICIGYRKGSDSINSRNNFGIMVNPKKNTEIIINPEDRLIVIAEDEL